MRKRALKYILSKARTMVSILAHAQNLLPSRPKNT